MHLPPSRAVAVSNQKVCDSRLLRLIIGAWYAIFVPDKKQKNAFCMEHLQGISPEVRGRHQDYFRVRGAGGIMFQVLVQFTLLTQPNHNVGVVSEPFPAAQQCPAEKVALSYP